MAEPGVLSTSFDATLPKNALLSKFTVTVTALSADEARLSSVATVRVEGARAVIDFGTLRTVRGLRLENLGNARVRAIRAWTGLAFGPESDAPFAETRTERLQVDLEDLGNQDFATHAWIQLSDAPADLDLRIEGGPVVWSHPGPVRPGSGGWNEDGMIQVDLTAAIAPLVGDPAGEGNVSLRFLLSARSPASLGLQTRVAFDRITRVTLKADELTFLAEGVRPVSLPPLAKPAEGLRTVSLPPLAEEVWIREIRFNAVGTFAPARVLEPVEPPVSRDAELTADPDHAFCVRLPPLQDDGGELAGDLTGVRLPLRAVPGGAEARVVLWAEADGEPAEPVDGGGSEPVSLEPLESPPGPDGDLWTLFPFRRPVPLVKGRRLWAALVVARGSATWDLIVAPAGGPFRNQELRRGGPAGPWRPLPSIFGPGSDLSALRGRVRSEFLPAKATPLPALLVQLTTAAATVAEVTPLPKGVPVVLRFSNLVPVGSLQVISRAAGTVSLREVDVVWSTVRPRFAVFSSVDTSLFLPTVGTRFLT